MSKAKEFQIELNLTIYPIVVEVTNLGVCYYKKDEVVPYHKHQVTEVHYIKEGKIRMIVGGRKYLVHKDGVYYTRAGDLHYLRALTETKMYYISFYLSRIPKKGVFKSDKTITLPRNDFLKLKQIFDYHSCAFMPTEKLLSGLNFVIDYAEGKRKVSFNFLREKFKEFISELCNILYDLTLKGRTTKIFLEDLTPPKRKIIKKVLSYLEKHKREKLNLPEIARKTYMSKRHLERIFKEIAGCSLIEYLMKLRIQESMKILKSKAVKIDEVIVKSGFKNRNSFYKYFKKFTGITPAEFRNYTTSQKEAILDIFAPK